jgi:hypothetical protein
LEDRRSDHCDSSQHSDDCGDELPVAQDDDKDLASASLDVKEPDSSLSDGSVDSLNTEYLMDERGVRFRDQPNDDLDADVVPMQMMAANPMKRARGRQSKDERLTDLKDEIDTLFTKLQQRQMSAQVMAMGNQLQDMINMLQAQGKDAITNRLGRLPKEKIKDLIKAIQSSGNLEHRMNAFSAAFMEQEHGGIAQLEKEITTIKEMSRLTCELMISSRYFGTMMDWEKLKDDMLDMIAV